MLNGQSKTIVQNLLFSVAIILTGLILIVSNSVSTLAANPVVSIDDIADYINNLSSISGTASDDIGVVSVRISIHDTTADSYWDGDSWESAGTWLDADGMGDWSYDTSSIPFTDGSEYTVGAISTDTEGNWSAEASDSFSFDSAQPAVTLNEIPDFLHTLASVSGTATDNSSGILSVELYIYDSAAGMYWDGDSWDSTQVFWFDAGTTGWSYDTSSIPLTDRSEYTVGARSTDIAGNRAVEVSDSFTCDITLPTVTLNVIPDLVNTLIISGTAADVTSGLSNKVQVVIRDTTMDNYWNGSSWTVGEIWLDANGFEEWSYDTSSILLTNGNSYMVKSMSIDGAGNESTEASASFTFDSTLPTVTLNEIPDFLHTLASVSGTAADALPGEMEKVQVQINDTTASNYWDGDSWESAGTWLDAEGIGDWSYDTSSITFINGSMYTVKAMSIDRAGNGSTEASDSFTFDSTLPTVTLNEITALVNSFFISGNASDASPGSLAAIQLLIQNTTNVTYWNGSFWIVPETWFNAAGKEGWSYSTSSVTFTDGDTYTIKTKAIDRAGNESTENSYGFTFDTAYPMVTNVTSTNSDGTYTTDDDIDITVIFSKEVKVTGSPYLELEMGTTIRSAVYESGDGTNTLTFKYTVQAGDISSDLDYKNTDSLKLDGGAIKDAMGKDAALTLAVPGETGSLGANKALVIEEEEDGNSLLWIILGSVFGGLVILLIIGRTIMVRKRGVDKEKAA